MKHVVITGASSGIGRAIAAKLAEIGDVFILTGRNGGKLQQTKALVESKGAHAHVVSADLSRTEDINQLLHEIRTSMHEINIFVHVAGMWHEDDTILGGTPYEVFSQKTVHDTYMVGLVAPALLVHGLLPLMHEGSSLLAVSGTFASGARGWLPYYGSKRGLEDLWVGLAQELVSRRIRVHCISPADTATEAYVKHFPQYVSESLHPEEVAEEVAHLASPDAAQEAVVLTIRKGQQPAPGFHA